MDKKYTVSAFETKDLREMDKFVKLHKNDIVAKPYQSTGTMWRVIYWEELAETI